MEKRRDIRFWLQHVWFGTLDHAPSPLAEEGGDGPPQLRGRADWMPIPRGLIMLLRRRGERRWNKHLGLLAYQPLAGLGWPVGQFH